MGDYFDDDDLINDYMEEEEPEFDAAGFDEAMLEEALAMEEAQNKQQQKVNTEENVQAMNMDEPDVEEEDAAMRDVDNADPSSEAATTTMTLRPQDDLFSFERFEGKQQWRTTTQSPTTAKQWKKASDESDKISAWEQAKAQLLDNAPKTTTPNAPEAQLLEFWNRSNHHNNRVHVVRRASSSTGIQLHPIPGRDCTPMTLRDGTRVHVMCHTENDEFNPKSSPSTTNILGVSMSELMRRSDAIIRKTERHKQTRKRVRFGGVEYSQVKEFSEDEEGLIERRTIDDTTKHHQLWVDKHAPSSFSHLLSDDRTNREVLRALRAWDPYVFRRQAPKRPLMLQRGREQQEQESTNNKGDNENNKKSAVKDLRPDESSRVILLSGPPGVGKTTLAHILARHAGYRPLEVNASDERSTSVLKERVVRAMESATLNLSGKSDDELAGRPNCLVLDEIDGADAKGAIAALVEIIRTEIPAPNSKRPVPYIRRPIIFICNHKYAPALRPLLPFAKQFDVSPPSSNRLVARLRAVLNEERMSVFGGSSLLHQLVAGTGGDIRSCLYTLQFASASAKELHAKKQWEQGADLGKDKAAVDISSALKASLGGSGMKDERNDVAGAVTAVFRKTKERLSSDTAGIRPSATGSARVLQLVENYGDNSRTLDCVFTNLPQVSYVDPSLERCTLAHEWLSGADIFRSNKTSAASNNTMEHHSMQRHHMPSAAGAIHLLCRVETRTNLTFSTRQLADARYQLESNTSLTQKFVEGLSPKARVSADTGRVAIETIPYSLWMLSAGVGSGSLRRTVSSLEVLSKNERAAFDAHVSLLRSLGLTYVARDDAAQRAYSDKGQNMVMRLEPQIDRLVRFQDLNLSPGQFRKSIPSALKELLAHRAAVEGMRDRDTQASREEKNPTKSFLGTDTSSSEGPKPSEGINQETTADKASVTPSPKRESSDTSAAVPPPKRAKVSAAPNFLGIGAAKAKAARNARKAALVGFDKSKKAKVSNTGSDIPMCRVCKFKYQKGFTQAVRTPCRMEDLV